MYSLIEGMLQDRLHSKYVRKSDTVNHARCSVYNVGNLNLIDIDLCADFKITIMDRTQ